MTDFLNHKFYNPSKGNLKFPQVIEEVFCYLKERPNEQYEVIVGCDSSSEENPNFPVALVVLRKGSGGRFFLTKINYQNEKKFYNLRERILQEVYLSCEMALLFRDALKRAEDIYTPKRKSKVIPIYPSCGDGSDDIQNGYDFRNAPEPRDSQQECTESDSCGN